MHSIAVVLFYNKTILLVKDFFTRFYDRINFTAFMIWQINRCLFPIEFRRKWDVSLSILISITFSPGMLLNSQILENAPQ
jgi:hypothetical protein